MDLGLLSLLVAIQHREWVDLDCDAREIQYHIKRLVTLPEEQFLHLYNSTLS